MNMYQNIDVHNDMTRLINSLDVSIQEGTETSFSDSELSNIIQYYESVQDYEKMYEIADWSEELYSFRSEFKLLKAKALFHMNRYMEAYSEVGVLEIFAPFQIEVSILRCKILALMANVPEAEEVLADIQAECPSAFVDINLCKSYIYEAKGEYVQMYEVLEAALVLNPENQEALERIWISVELSKKFDESIRFHNLLVDKNPYTYLAWFNLGHAYSCRGDYSRAIEAFEYCFTIRPDFEAAYLDCAEICIEIQDFNKALNTYLDALAHTDTDVELFLPIGKCFHELKDYVEARKWLTNARRYDAYNDEVYYYLAEGYRLTASYDKAIEQYEKAIALDDGIEDYFLGLGKVYACMKDETMAYANFELACGHFPENPEIWTAYIMAAASCGNIWRMKSIIEESKQFLYDDTIEVLNVHVRWMLGEEKEAIAMLSKLIAGNRELVEKLDLLPSEILEDSRVQSMLNYWVAEA